MKKLVIFLTVIMLLAAGGAWAKDWKNVRIGVEGAYPPFSSVTPDGKLVGFDIDIAYALCEAMGAECKLIQQEWDGMIPALMAKKYDCIIASMSITEERMKKIAFSNKYYNTPGKLAAKKGTVKKWSKNALKGKTIGVQRETIHDRFHSDEFGKIAKEIKRYGTQDEVYLDAKAGRIDFIAADSVALDAGFLKTPDGKSWEFVGPDFTDVKYFGTGAGVGIRKSDQDLVKMFNAAIKKIRANGTYKKIQDKYFDFNVYGAE